MAKDTVRIGSIVMNCDDFGRMMAFWREAFGYVQVRPPAPGDPFVILKDPEGKGPNVSIDQGEPERGQLHLDLYTNDPRRRSQTPDSTRCDPVSAPGAG